MDSNNLLQSFDLITDLELNKYGAFGIPVRDYIANMYVPYKNTADILNDPETTAEVATMTQLSFLDLFSALPLPPAIVSTLKYPNLRGFFERETLIGDPANPTEKDLAIDYWNKTVTAIRTGITLGLLSFDFTVVADVYVPYYLDVSEGLEKAVMYAFKFTNSSVIIKENDEYITLPIALTDTNEYKFMIAHAIPEAAVISSNDDLIIKINSWYDALVTTKEGVTTENVADANALAAGNPKFWKTNDVTSMAGLFQNRRTENHPDIRYWYMSRTTDFTNMFSGSTFNNPLSPWERVLPTASVLRNIQSKDVRDFTNMFAGSEFDQFIVNWDVKAFDEKNPPFLTNMVGDVTVEIDDGEDSSGYKSVTYQSALRNTDKYEQGFKDGPATPDITLFGQAICFNKGTQILCMKNNQEVYVAVENLRKGDLVKTLNDGYKPIQTLTVGTFTLGRPMDMGMYKMKQEGSMMADLEMTGLHSILVNENDEEHVDDVNRQITTQPNRKLYVKDHFRLHANYSSKFEKMPTNAYTIYSFSLEGQEAQYGIWANGVLVESTSEEYVLSGAMKEVLEHNEDTKKE